MSATEPSTKASSRWQTFKSALADRLGMLFILSPVLIPLAITAIYVPCYRASLTPVEFTVSHRERVTYGSGDSVQSHFLVWSKEGEVFCVVDSWSFLRFDAADRYGQLHEGARVKAQVAGWRIHFFSWYRNVLLIDQIDGSKTPANSK